MDLRLNDIVEMKKPHPCGEKLWLVTRVGMDIQLKCTRCGREVMLPRSKAEHNIKSVQHSQEKPFDSAGGFSPEKEGGK